MASTQKEQPNITTERPPIIVVMGHIDHGKSTLLDYIRKTNVVAGEAGGITQHLSAYEVVHKDQKGVNKHITFLDTPGHEAFSAMRARGAKVADIAILVVSAEDGIKAQTLEALSAIKESKIPFIVAINKIDKPSANIEKTRNELAEKEIYTEGYGGDIPCVPISAKTGLGVPELLDMMLLVAEIAELKANPNLPAEGVVAEAHVDPKRGISATLIITNGTLKKGMCVVAGDAYAPVRAISDHTGALIEEATFSSPVRITGFSKIPAVGSSFKTASSAKSARVLIDVHCSSLAPVSPNTVVQTDVVIPLVIKADVLGTLEAIEKELAKVTHEKICWKIIQQGVGDITENDIKSASGSPDTIVLGFRVRIDDNAASLAEKLKIPVETFAIIYNITDYIEKVIKERAPKERVEESTGKIKILRVFSKAKDKQVLGGKVLEGMIATGSSIKIVRRDTEIGKGKVLELQQQKIKTNEVKEGLEFGTMIESKMEIAVGDVIEPFISVIR
ncbi:MAG: translation initiation factor IF-2 [Patescibacteria group bacterium]